MNEWLAQYPGIGEFKNLNIETIWNEACHAQLKKVAGILLKEGFVGTELITWQTYITWQFLLKESGIEERK